MSLDQYIKSFSLLRTDKNRKRWSALTTYQAPHKPFMLLSIMDLIVQGSITKNFIEPSFELLDTFNTYWNSIMPLGSKTSMAYPFPRLKTDGFWHLVPNPGYENQIDIDFSSMTKLREVCAGARMDDELFQLMCNPETREQLGAVLIKTLNDRKHNRDNFLKALRIGFYFKRVVRFINWLKIKYDNVFFSILFTRWESR